MPRLIIENDTDCDSPRESDSNIGYLFTHEAQRRSPDGESHDLYKIMVDTSHEATGTDNHIELIKAQALAEFKESAPKDGNSHDEDLHIIEIHPVYRMEHGNVIYKRGTAGGFDYSNCGFYIVTAQSISGETHTAESIAKNIDSELDTYTRWCNGEVYRFTLLDDEGEQIEGCGGYYDIEDMRDLLPSADWNDEKLSEYII